jgi:hypothetical protein
MKTIILSIMMLLTGAFLCCAQSSGVIEFNDYGSPPSFSYTTIYFNPGNIPLGGWATGPAPTLTNYSDEVTNGLDWTVELWGAPEANAPVSALVPLVLENNPNAYAAAAMDSEMFPGTWDTFALAMLAGSVPGQPATLQLRAYYNAGGTVTNYAQAMEEGVPFGQSLTLNVSSLGGGLYPPPVLPAFDDFDVSSQGTLGVEILTQPQSLILYTSNSFSLSVTAIGAPPLSYQWVIWPNINPNGSVIYPDGDGTALIGQTNPVLTLSNITISSEYALVISNAYNSVTSTRCVVIAPYVPSFLPPTNIVGGVVLQWPGLATNYTLESSDTYGPGAVWSPVPVYPVLLRGGFFTLTDNITAPAKFYRLQRQ